jgi:hypothetical protein
MQESPTPEPTIVRRKRYALFAVVGCITVLLLAASVLAYKIFTASGTTLPTAIAQQVTFSVYLPGKLPGNYTIDRNSFSTGEETLIFQATDTAGGIISFAEQPKPKKFNFNKFYLEKISNTKTHSNVPHASVSGVLKDNQTKLLSIVTDDTWITVSTTAPLQTDDFQLIAANIRKTKP